MKLVAEQYGDTVATLEVERDDCEPITNEELKIIQTKAQLAGANGSIDVLLVRKDEVIDHVIGVA